MLKTREHSIQDLCFLLSVPQVSENMQDAVQYNCIICVHIASQKGQNQYGWAGRYVDVTVLVRQPLRSKDMKAVPLGLICT